MSLGEPIPAGSHHSLSVSLPEWRDNVGYQEAEPRVMNLLRTGYPRFVIHESVKELSEIILQRAGRPGERALPFPSRKVASAFKAFCGDATRILALDIGDAPSGTDINLHVVLFPEDVLPRAKAFWQHTGWGISSRLADFCRARLRSPNAQAVDASTLAVCPNAQGAKRVLRERIAGAVKREHPGSALRGHVDVSSDDVFLYPSGMSAIWAAHQLVLAVRPAAKSVCFGHVSFHRSPPAHVLTKWGPGCQFFGEGDSADMKALEMLLAATRSANPSEPPVLAIFCETPSNPLLRSVDVERFRMLADQYDALLVIDETIGNFVNVDVLPVADILVTSLTKVFSGAQNVMGGSLVLNPNGRHYTALLSSLEGSFEDLYWPEDALEMERNSRDFATRVYKINANAEALADFLLSSDSAALKHVFYPKWETRQLFDALRRPGGGFGGLLSITFAADAAAHAFYDALRCHKGPSLGTNFTLACPYTILAHYAEREWAARYGVEEGLVRISVGLEPVEELLDICRVAVDAAEAALCRPRLLT
ncbi:PLP-dependent transferase [Auricularia subglabra TFB-10046 SS5]|nr:PLP-dependent transferase [Auricularia subglabra TFB-10046 SS5]